MNNSVWEKQRKRLFELIEIGSNYDAWCWGYDFFNTFTILLNLTVSIMYTFDNIYEGKKQNWFASRLSLL